MGPAAHPVIKITKIGGFFEVGDFRGVDPEPLEQ
jgi:hypothetical protein